MNMNLHNPPEYIDPILRCYQRSQIDYIEHYIRLYIAYNAWYREVTGTSNDREALAKLKKRTVLWNDYANGRTMRALSVYMEKLVDLTQHEPLGKTIYWSGSIESVSDWRALIEYWYQIRCLLVHGVNVKPRFVWLAYETLDIFMNEIIDRVQQTIKAHIEQVGNVSTAHRTSDSRNIAFQQLRDKLYKKYVTSPDIWQVDMERVL